MFGTPACMETGTFPNLENALFSQIIIQLCLIAAEISCPSGKLFVKKSALNITPFSSCNPGALMEALYSGTKKAK